LLNALTRIARFWRVTPSDVLRWEPEEVALAEACMIAHLDEVQSRVRETGTVFPVVDLGA
jgi:hypothetical protein